MVKPHLYILAFNDNEHFKLGISIAPNQNRISKHISTYGVDVSKSLVVSCDNKNSIKLLEKNLKHITSKVITEDSPYYGLDGHTEIRKNEQLEEVMGIIGMFKPILGLDIEGLKIDDKKINLKADKADKTEKPKKSIFGLYDNEKTYCGISTTLRVFMHRFKKIEILKCEISQYEYVRINVDLSFLTERDFTKMMNVLMSDFVVGSSKFSLCDGYMHDDERTNVSLSMSKLYFHYRDIELSESDNNIKKDYEQLIEEIIKKHNK